ncbi:MAG TPA: hypothetical protein VJP02_28320, partial [Candidatus Sulfotelmatobacter sp.]|nr:hypothetical protein [Candidatus Sulfotelmatobacter sp.]
DGIGSDLDAFVATCPILGFSEQLLAYTAMTVILGNIPTLDVAHGLRWVAAVRMRAEVDFQETDQDSIVRFCDEDGDWHS